MPALMAQMCDVAPADVALFVFARLLAGSYRILGATTPLAHLPRTSRGRSRSSVHRRGGVSLSGQLQSGYGSASKSFTRSKHPRGLATVSSVRIKHQSLQICMVYPLEGTDSTARFRNSFARRAERVPAETVSQDLWDHAVGLGVASWVL